MRGAGARSGRKPGKQIFMASIALDRVAVAAQELQVVKMIGASFRYRNDVINREIPNQEMLPASVADSSLFSVQEFPVVGMVVFFQWHNVGALGYVGAVDAGLECAQSDFPGSAWP